MNNKYDFLSNLISLINSYEYSSTIKSLSEECNVPIEYMRHTFVALLKNQFVGECFCDSMDGSSDSVMESFYDNPRETAELIISGNYDDVEWNINSNILFSEGDEILPLSSIELSELAKSLGVDVTSVSELALYEKKIVSAPVSNDVISNLKVMQQAINDRKSVTFRYRKHDNNITKTIFPIQIISSINDNWIYVYSSNEELYRLDRIANRCIENNNGISNSSPSINPAYKYAWGLPSKDELEPTYVKIRINPTTKNIVNKVRNDLYLRQKLDSYKFYKEGEYFVYEDKVLGLKSFKRWIRSYGSSMIVLEPKELGNSFLTRAYEILDYYKQLEE